MEDEPDRAVPALGLACLPPGAEGDVDKMTVRPERPSAWGGCRFEDASPALGCVAGPGIRRPAAP